MASKKNDTGYSPSQIKLIYKTVAQFNSKQEAFKLLATKLGRTAAAISAWYYANEKKKKKAAENGKENGEMQTQDQAEIVIRPNDEISTVVGYMVNMLDREQKTALAKKLIAEVF